MKPISRFRINPLLFILPDLGLMYLGLYLTILFKYDHSLSPEKVSLHYQIFSWLFLVWLLVFFIYGLFDHASLRRYARLILTLFSAMLANFVIAVIYFYYQPELLLTPRRFLLLDVSLTFAFILVWHLFIKTVWQKRNIENIYLLPLGEDFSELSKEISNHSYLGYRIKGVLESTDINKDLSNAMIIVSPTAAQNAGLVQDLYFLRRKQVNFFDPHTFYEMISRKVFLQFDESWFLQNIDYGERRFFGLLKRVSDFFAGLILGVIFIVAFIPVTLLVKLSSSGPLLFVQERIGKDGVVFIVRKFRTMKKGTNQKGWTEFTDDRITGVGKFLRKTRLDELPQFINLLDGTMSLVGPRPEQVEIVEEVKKLIPFFDERHIIKPGLTGWAQLNVYASNLDETRTKLQYDLYYIKHRSILFDAEIILKTIYHILSGSGR